MGYKKRYLAENKCIRSHRGALETAPAVAIRPSDHTNALADNASSIAIATGFSENPVSLIGRNLLYLAILAIPPTNGSKP